jgi:hypothetical protein
VLQRELINPMELVTTFMSYCDQPSDNQYVDVLRGRLPRRAERVLRGEARAQLEKGLVVAFSELVQDRATGPTPSPSARQERSDRRRSRRSHGARRQRQWRTQARDRPIEAIRMLRVATAGAVKAKTAAANKLLAVLVTTPEPLRSQLRQLSTAKLIDACLQLPPAPHEPPSPCPGRQTRAALDRHSSPSYRET